MNKNTKKNNFFAIMGFALSFIFTFIGLILSIIGLCKSKELNGGKGLSIAGIIISSFKIIIGFLSLVIVIIVFGFNYNFIEDNIKFCSLSYSCIENSDGTYNCKYKDSNYNEKDIKCMFDNTTIDRNTNDNNNSLDNYKLYSTGYEDGYVGIAKNYAKDSYGNLFAILNTEYVSYEEIKSKENFINDSKIKGYKIASNVKDIIHISYGESRIPYDLIVFYDGSVSAINNGITQEIYDIYINNIKELQDVTKLEEKENDSNLYIGTKSNGEIVEIESILLKGYFSNSFLQY